MTSEPGHGLCTRRFRQFKEGAWRDFDDVFAPEEHLRLHWAQGDPKELLAFPDRGDGWRHLALGHAWLDLCPEGQRPVLVAQDGDDFHLEPRPHAEGAVVAPCPVLAPETILAAMADFIQGAGRWDDTGCFHRMAVYAPLERRFVKRVEDIGRHNCLDRVAGHCLEAGLDPRGLVLFVSARATGSLVAKAVRAGFAMMVSRSAVTSGGMRRAKAGGLTLLGFAREIRFTVFTDSRGLVQDPQPVGSVAATECPSTL